MAYEIKRADYALLFGPTTGDKVQLGDTSLVLEVEKDLAGALRRIKSVLEGIVAPGDPESSV